MYLQRATAFSACILSAGVIYAQTNPTNPEATIQALLAEVRQLRLTLERSAVVAPKVQVTLQRIQLQQENVSRLSRQLEDVRDRISQAAVDAARTVAEVKQVEARFAQEQDPLRRKSMEDEIRVGKSRVELEREQQNVQLEQQRARESELASRLSTEQAKLDALNDHLSALEQLLEPQQPKQP